MSEINIKLNAKSKLFACLPDGNGGRQTANILSRRKSILSRLRKYFFSNDIKIVVKTVIKLCNKYKILVASSYIELRLHGQHGINFQFLNFNGHV